jgi:predicted TIM-barrel fold metal-dependent hydrolase
LRKAIDIKKKDLISRRTTLKTLGAVGASAFLSPEMVQGGEFKPDIRKTIFEKVFATPLIDTHEHLIEEKGRLAGTSHFRVASDDFSIIFSHYLKSDMFTAGMPQKDIDSFVSSKIDPVGKWKLLEPYWPAIKNTGYGQAVSITIKELYGVEKLSEKTIKKVQAGYEKTRRKGFYKHILCEKANIESCQVNSLEGRVFMESDMPTLLMQDISILGMLAGPDFKQVGEPTGIKVSSLGDWHKVIDWWFNRYSRYAVAVKSQHAYSRDIDHEKVAAEKVESIFKKRLEGQDLTAGQQKALEDHLFWYAVEKATEHNLPVKLHTGYYAGHSRMPLSRLIKNPGSASDLCRVAPETRFVFMHICYPYYEPMIALAKQYANAYIDMCWSWIINPVAAKDFLKKYLVTAPANKILTFGADYIPVEPVLGHAVITRRGIALAVSELVEEGWLSLECALEIIESIMHQNARKIFNLAVKEKNLKKVRW